MSIFRELVEGQRRYRERERRRVQYQATPGTPRPLTHGGIMPKEKSQVISMSRSVAHSYITHRCNSNISTMNALRYIRMSLIVIRVCLIPYVNNQINDFKTKITLNPIFAAVHINKVKNVIN